MSNDMLEPSAFHIEQEVELNAPLDQAWKALCDVDAWWSHRFDMPDSHLELDPRPGGLFVQKGQGSDGVVFGQVLLLQERLRIRLSGHLGQKTPVVGVYQWELEDRGETTLLKLRHQCVGLIPQEAHESYDQGWRELWVNLKDYIENGKRVNSGA